MSLQHSEILYKYLWTMDTNKIESIKTTSMEDVSTRVLEKKRIFKKVKPKKDLMYQDIYNCICQNTKKWDSLSIMSNLLPNCCLKFDFQKGVPISKYLVELQT